jgi:sugar/nucleoside kinase (ribokinase family)
MDCWIENNLNDLTTLLERIHCLIINEDEARQLADEHNLITAAEKILAMGPGILVIKKGESGSLTCCANGEKFLLPAYPATDVKDPTGAGDSFAGALMGYLSSSEADLSSFESLRTAVAYGTVVASFTVADFSLKGLASITKSDIDNRFETLRKITQF